MNEWISVKDRLPSVAYSKRLSFVNVLVTDGEKVDLVKYRQLFSGNQALPVFHTFCDKCIDGDVFEEVTHWMPVSMPPDQSNTPSA